MESIAFPLSFVALVWVFGGMLAAAMPMAVGGFAIVCTLATLRAITFVADVSIFALNLTVAMGLALAIDYTLLIISRYRDEIADGMDPRPGAGSHDVHGRTYGAVFRDDRCAVDDHDGAVPDVLPEVVRLRGHRGGRVGRRRRGGDYPCGRSCCSATGWTR